MKKIVGKFILKNRIDKYVKKLPIDERFKPLISDIVLRRAAQFSRNYGELRTDLEALANNLERIRIVDRSKMAVHNYALAVYCCADKEILISEDTLKESPERIYQIIAHELFHVMLKNNRGIDKFDKYNYILGTRSNLFQELIAEKGSYRITYPVKNDYTGYNCNVFGYEDVSFVLDFIEATYGVSEQDVLKYSLKGRRDLAKFLASVAGEEIYEAEEFLDEIEVGGTLLLSTLYEDGDARTKRQKSKDEIDENIVASIDSLFSVCQSKIEDRLRNADAYTVEELDRIKDEIAFSECRLINILKDRLGYFRDELGVDVENLWKKCIDDYAEEVIIRLCDMEQLLSDSVVRSSEIELESVSAIRGYTFDDDEFYQRFFSKRLKNRSFKASKEIYAEKREHSMYTEGWKNKRIIKLIGRIVESERENASKSRTIRPKLAYEAQQSKGSLDTYKLTDEQQKAYMDALKHAQENSFNTVSFYDKDETNINNEKE